MLLLVQLFIKVARRYIRLTSQRHSAPHLRGGTTMT
jgi:hypothetical protein